MRCNQRNVVNLSGIFKKLLVSEESLTHISWHIFVITLCKRQISKNMCIFMLNHILTETVWYRQPQNTQVICTFKKGTSFQSLCRNVFHDELLDHVFLVKEVHLKLKLSTFWMLSQNYRYFCWKDKNILKHVVWKFQKWH